MWLVIGYGNELRGDDGFGIRVAEELQKKDISHLSEIIATQQLLPEHAEAISRADGVIFIDADASLPAGTFNFASLSENPAPLADPAFSHHLTPQLLIGDARLLFGHAPQSFLYSVGGSSLALGEQLSPKVKALVSKIAELILNKIQSTVSTHPKE